MRESEHLNLFIRREESREKWAPVYRFREAQKGWGLRRSGVNRLLSDESQARQRYLRVTIDILVHARGELMADPDYDLQAASMLWAMINRMIDEGRKLASAGWSTPGEDGWYTRLQNLRRQQ